jgi:flagellar basal body P-ring protein FlgI
MASRGIKEGQLRGWRSPWRAEWSSVAWLLMSVASSSWCWAAEPAQTIGDITAVSGTEGIAVQGYGLVVGLAGTGSNPPPSHARNVVLHEMQRREVPNPEALLRSPQTAMVTVLGVIPPGARKGDRFDVEVRLLPEDQATSLRGGWLLETALYEVAAFQGIGTLHGERLATAVGPVLVSTDSPEGERSGRISGGGHCQLHREFQLLTGNRYRSARYTIEIARRINERFPVAGPGSKPLAEAKNDAQVELRVPPIYRHHPARFLAVVRAIPLWSQNHTDAAVQERLKQLGQELRDPGRAPGAALALESIGKRSIPVLKKALDDPSPDVRFFAAESLAYLGDPVAAGPLAETARLIPDYRAHALTALAILDEAAARLQLRNLLGEDGEPELRYGAFKALRTQDQTSPDMRGQLLGNYISLHVVDVPGRPLIHVTTRGVPEIVIFGKNQRFLTPLMLRAGPELLLTSNTGDPSALLTRHSVRRPRVRETVPLEIEPCLKRLVDLGASYPDLVELFKTADRNFNLPGGLAVDAIPDPLRLYARLRQFRPAEDQPEGPPLPNLFRIFAAPERRPPASGVRPAAAEISGPTVEENGKRYLARPSFWERLLRRRPGRPKKVADP